MPVYADFAKALLSDEGMPPAGIRVTATRVPDSAGLKSRFDIYRNTRMTGLVAALQQIFPVVLQLVGEQAFNALARIYAQEHPPKSPYLFEYGDQFPALLRDRTELQALSYLCEVAKIEFAVLRATHAADTTPVREQLAALVETPAQLEQARFGFAPSFALLDMSFASGSIWLAHQQDPADLESINPDQSEWVMISRPGYAVAVDRITAGEFEFISLLLQGWSVGAALAQVELDFDLILAFQRLIEREVLVSTS